METQNVAPDLLIEALTIHEARVMGYVAQGKATKEIARTLGVSGHTINTHVRNVCRKVNEGGRWAALVKAVRLGLLPTLGELTAIR